VNYDLNDPEGLANAAAWQRSLFNLVNEGGVWGVPRCKSSFHISHANKTVTLVDGPGEDGIRRVTAAMGWTYVGAKT
jgi:hypothetical protein